MKLTTTPKFILF